MTDIKIPKKSFAGFMLGMTLALLLLFCIGAVLAATVFNGGGGTISNLGTPSASDDISTKGYADAATAGTCVPLIESRSFANSGSSTVCTGCTGRVSMLVHHVNAASGSTSCRIGVDGTLGQTEYGQLNNVYTYYIYAAEFTTNLTITATDTTTSATVCEVYYCLDQ